MVFALPRKVDNHLDYHTIETFFNCIVVYEYTYTPTHIHPNGIICQLSCVHTSNPNNNPILPLNYIIFSQFEAVLFDVDGTLCDSFNLAYTVTGEVLKAHGRDQNITEEQYHACTRFCTAERLARHLAPQLGLNTNKHSPAEFRC